MIYLIGISITVFLALVLIGKQKKSLSDKILLIWLLVIAGHLFLYYLNISNKLYDYPFLLGIHLPYPLLHGPLLYLYTAALTNKISTKNYSWLFHFIPILPFYAYLVPFFNLKEEEKIEIFQNGGAGYEAFLMINIWSIFISGIVYVSISLYLLKQYKESIKNNFSFTEKINLSWLRYLIYGIGFIWLLVFLGNDNAVFGVTVLYVVFLGFFGIRQVGIFSHNLRTIPLNTHNNNSDSILPKNKSESNLAKTKYAKSTLTDDQASEIHKALTRAIEDDKLYKNPELTLSALASTLDVHPNNLSQVINSFEEKNFYDYINEKRVNAFINMVAKLENRRFTLLSLALDCGFNSKPSFNRNFKKVTGLSPTEYILQLKKEV